MKHYNPVDVCHYCNDRMYEYLKQKIQQKIDLLDERKQIEDGEDIPFLNSTETVKQILKSLLQNE